MKPKVLIINSYAGSLTIAATQLGCDIIGSYEDAGFGLPVQKANFPDLKYVDKLPWPKQDLKGVHVIAHPPCAAFSRQFSASTGVDEDSFKCHKQVMEYALSQNCVSLSIESVPGILEGAAEIHEAYAKKYKYNVYRIKQNAVTFGVPQWRPRVWILWTREPQLILNHKRSVRSLSKILRPRGTELQDNNESKVAFAMMRLAGWTDKRIREELLSGERIGNVLKIASEIYELDRTDNFAEARKKLNLGGRFVSKVPRVLNPEGFATTILRDSSFFVLGRELFLEEYCEAMGFPAKYKWPIKEVKHFRSYLSKGVCPPVAKWILEQVSGLSSAHALAQQVILKPGETADFNVTKKQIQQRDFSEVV